MGCVFFNYNRKSSQVIEDCDSHSEFCSCS